jgi:hypothetical protein
VVLIAIGTAGYMAIEHMSLDDAVFHDRDHNHHRRL